MVTIYDEFVQHTQSVGQGHSNHGNHSDHGFKTTCELITGDYACSLSYLVLHALRLPHCTPVIPDHYHQSTVIGHN